MKRTARNSMLPLRAERHFGRERKVLDKSIFALILRHAFSTFCKSTTFDIRQAVFPRAFANFWRVYRELADNWVLLDNGETAIQNVVGGSRKQMTIRDPTAYANFLELVESSNNG